MQCIVAQLFVKPECAEEYEAEFMQKVPKLYKITRKVACYTS